MSLRTSRGSPAVLEATVSGLKNGFDEPRDTFKLQHGDICISSCRFAVLQTQPKVDGKRSSLSYGSVVQTNLSKVEGYSLKQLAHLSYHGGGWMQSQCTRPLPNDLKKVLRLG